MSEFLKKNKDALVAILDEKTFDNLESGVPKASKAMIREKMKELRSLLK